MNIAWAYRMSRCTSLLSLLLILPGCMLNPFDGVVSSFSKRRFDFKGLEEKENVFPIVIIGSGPAGLAAGLYGARANKKTLVIEGNKPGGLLTETSYVENWPGFKSILGKDLMKELKEQAAHFGAQFLEDSVEKVDFHQWPYAVHTQDGKTIYSLSLIIATGASPLFLKIPGEQEYWARGVATCAVCDAPFYQGKEVAIVGGGDSAIAEAIQLAAYAKKITILVRKDKMRAAPANQELLKGYPHISVLYNVEPKRIIGNEKHVTAIELYNNREKVTKVMAFDGVFLAIGHKPNTDLFAQSLKVDDQKYIIVENRTQATSMPGVFAAGDVEDHRYRQAGVAAGSGIKAALDADAFLNEIGFNAEVAARLEPKQRAPVAVAPSLVRHVASLTEFEQSIKSAKVPVVVDFYADYCSSCMAMLPHFNAVSQQFKDYAEFISIDVAALPEISAKYYVSKIPCILVFKDGSLKGRFNNAMGKKELAEMVAQFVGHTPAEREK